MVIDLSYAKEGPKPGPETIRSINISIHGWVVGYAIFEGQEPRAVGHFRIRSHDTSNKPVPATKKAIGALQTLAKVSLEGKVQLVVAYVPDTSAPLWWLPGVLAMTLRVAIGDTPEWERPVGKAMVDLTAWAHAITGKKPDDPSEVHALSLGASAASARCTPQIITPQTALLN